MTEKNPEGSSLAVPRFSKTMLFIGLLVIGGVTWVKLSLLTMRISSSLPLNTNISHEAAVTPTPPAAHPCLLAQQIDAASPVNGWLRYQDSSSCFTLDYPKGWRIDTNDAAVHLWSPTNVHRDDLSYESADVIVEKPHDEGDEKAMYDTLLRKGWKDVGRGTLIGPWMKTAAGDGSSLGAQTQQRRAFTGRGVFQISLVHNQIGGVSESVLEKIAESFTAQ